MAINIGKIVALYQGDAGMRSLAAAEHFRVMAFAQLTWRESLRDIEASLVYAALMLWASDRVFPVGRPYARLALTVILIMLAAAAQAWAAALNGSVVWRLSAAILVLPLMGSLLTDVRDRQQLVQWICTLRHR